MLGLQAAAFFSCLCWLYCHGEAEGLHSTLLEKHYKCFKVLVLSKDRIACPGCQTCPWRWEMGNGKCPFQCWLFSMLCFAANTALGWICVLVFRSWGGLCVHKELGGCLVAEKDVIRHMGIEPGCRGQAGSCQKWGQGVLHPLSLCGVGS